MQTSAFAYADQADLNRRCDAVPDERESSASPAVGAGLLAGTVDLSSWPTVPPLMPIPDFCRLFGVGRSFAYNEAKAGRLRFTKIRGMTRVAAPDAFAWLNTYRSTPEA